MSMFEIQDQRSLFFDSPSLNRRGRSILAGECGSTITSQRTTGWCETLIIIIGSISIPKHFSGVLHLLQNLLRARVCRLVRCARSSAHWRSQHSVPYWEILAIPGLDFVDALDFSFELGKKMYCEVDYVGGSSRERMIFIGPRCPWGPIYGS